MLKKDLVSEILFDFGLQEGGEAHLALAEICKRRMEKYVPKDTGLTRDTAIAGNGYVKYIQPYDSYIYKGISKNGNPYKYKTPGTGSYWDKKMMSAEGDDVAKEFQNWLDRR